MYINSIYKNRFRCSALDFSPDATGVMKRQTARWAALPPVKCLSPRVLRYPNLTRQRAGNAFVTLWLAFVPNISKPTKVP
jgi:hypothetical protein